MQMRKVGDLHILLKEDPVTRAATLSILSKVQGSARYTTVDPVMEKVIVYTE